MGGEGANRGAKGAKGPSEGGEGGGIRNRKLDFKMGRKPRPEGGDCEVF